VQKIIETGRGAHAGTIGLMHKMSQVLLKKRMKEGSIDFETVETKFRFDDEGKPKEIIKKREACGAPALSRIFCCLPNQVVAKHIGLVRKEEQTRPFIYRIPRTPRLRGKLADLAAFVEHLGYSLNISGGLGPRVLQKTSQ